MLAAMIPLLFALEAHTYFKPHATRMLVQLEYVSLFCAYIILCCGILYLVEMPNDLAYKWGAIAEKLWDVKMEKQF